MGFFWQNLLQVRPLLLVARATCPRHSVEGGLGIPESALAAGMDHMTGGVIRIK